MNVNKDKFNIFNNIKWYEYIFIVVLAVFPVLHVATGLDLTDTSYSLGNFENFAIMNPTWSIATFGANVTGTIFTHLPGGHTWLGMNIYTSIFLCLFTLLVYLLIRQYVSPWIAFAGEFIALSLCWAPHTVLYHYMSYYLLTIATIVLLIGIYRESRVLMLMAGIVLGFNVFVRFPNIVDCGLIICVWAYGIFNKSKFVKELVNTLICIGGFIIGCVINLLIVTVIYGPSSFVDMIGSLFGMTNTATGYTPKSMVWGIVNHFLIFKKPFIILAGIIVVLVTVGIFTHKKIVRYLSFVLEAILFAAFMFWARRNGFYSFDYKEYQSMVMFAVLFLYIAGLMGIATVIFVKDKFTRVVALSTLVTIAVTPLGSNNGLYPVFNNMFLIAPFTIYCGLCLVNMCGTDYESLKSRLLIQLRNALVLFGAFATATFAIFGFVFVFRDTGFPVHNSVAVTGISKVAGMHTNKANADKITGIYEYAESNGLVGNAGIFYGNFPGLSYILEMPSAIGHSWADLDSFTAEEMKENLSTVSVGTPVIVSNVLTGDMNVIDDEDPAKVKLLKTFIANNGYSLDYTDGEIEVYMVK